MPLNSMPAIDAQACSGWTEQQINLYQSLPFYLAKQQVEKRKTWAIWSKFTKKRKWTPNMGSIMRGVRSEPSPHLRQFAFPNRLQSMPKKDVVDLREVTNEAELYRHRFESPVLNFFPSFNDFMDHVDEHSTDIMEKIERFNDIYIRGNIFHMAPYILVATGNSCKLIAANAWKGTGTFNTATDGKTQAALFDYVSNTQGISNLTLASLSHMLSIMETDLRIPFFNGQALPKDDQALAGKYALVTSTEAFGQFTFDPYVRDNKNCQLDIVNESFKGNFFGRITSKLEDLPLRMKADGSFPAPEIRVDNGLNVGESIASTSYSVPDENGSQFEWAFLVGGNGYESLEVGPPPKPFSSDSPPENFPKMFWNGEVKLTKHFLVPCVDSDTGNVVQEANTYGEHLKFISQIALGILPAQRRNIIPVLFRRKRGV